MPLGLKVLMTIYSDTEHQVRNMIQSPLTAACFVADNLYTVGLLSLFLSLY